MGFARFGAPDLGLLERGLDYKSRHALGLEKGPVLRLQVPACPGSPRGGGPEVQVPACTGTGPPLRRAALTLKEPWNSSLILRSSRP